MKDFRTTVSISPSENKIDLKTPVFTVGSCFSDVIGFQLDQYKMPVRVNPFGVIYNPVSIHNVLGMAIRNQSPGADSFAENQGIHMNFDFHSELSALSKPELSDRIAQILNDAHAFLSDTKCVIITYGTAWVYRLKSSGKIVANCHKMPAKDFEKQLMRVDDIVSSFDQLHRQLTSINPHVHFILTVSPVRHIKDTLSLNNVSKSVLRTATHEIVNTFDRVEYFPSFEIMMDDLRDYRFYKSDMIHPSIDAEKYIWEKFSETYFNSNTRKVMDDFDKILSAINHKPFHPTSAGHQQFLKETLRKLENLKAIIDVEREIEIVRQQIV